MQVLRPCSRPPMGGLPSSCGTGGRPRGRRNRRSTMGSEKAIFHIWLYIILTESARLDFYFAIDGRSHISYMVTVEFVKVRSETAMSRLISAPFFSAHPVFSRAEYAARSEEHTSEL